VETSQADPEPVDWSKDEVFSGPGRLADKHRQRVTTACAMYREMFDRRVAAELEPADVPALTEAVRADVVHATRRTVWTDLVRSGFQATYNFVTVVALFYVVLPWVTLDATDGPWWLRVALVLLVSFLALVELLPSTDPLDRASEVAVGVAAACVIALLFWPAGRLGVWAELGVVGAACVAATGVLVLADWMIGRWTGLSFNAAVLVLGIAVAYWGFRYRGSSDAGAWWESGLLLGVTLGAMLAGVLAALQFLFATFTGLRRLSDFRMGPEGMVTKSALHVMRMVEDDDRRPAVVSEVEYLALLLERGVGGVLCQEDPPSAESVRAELGVRAARLRALKRQFLFGRPGAKEALLAWLDDAVPAVARRDWLALPVAESGDKAVQAPRTARVSRALVRLFVFLLPAILLGVVWVSGGSLDTVLPAALPFTVIWMGVQLAELATPGSADELSRSASATSGTSSVLAQILHGPSSR
jgi:hypothetical protein